MFKIGDIVILKNKPYIRCVVVCVKLNNLDIRSINSNYILTNITDEIFITLKDYRKQKLDKISKP